MPGIDVFLWAVCPYLSLAVLVMGTVLRRIYFARTWTAKSSEFLERKQERVATPLFHAAILFVVCGHVGGLLVPKEVTDYLGVSEQLYHAIAFVAGGAAGSALVVSVALLVKRRFGSNKRMRANTSAADKLLYCVLALTIFAGMAATLSNAGGAFDYRESLAPWIRGVLLLQPDPALMAQAPLLFKLHMLCWMLLFALIPFTRLVHLFSGLTAPFKSLGRAPILYRRRNADVAPLARKNVRKLPPEAPPFK